MILPLFAYPVRGLFEYRHNDGVVSMIACSNKTVYDVDVGKPDKRILGYLQSDAECYAVNAGGKLWIVNGTDFVKIEDDLHMFKVQISPPDTASANSIASGGTLPTGEYSVYVAYARVENSGIALYSYPVLAASLQVAKGTQTVSAQCIASTDPQVNKRAVFMTEAGGKVPYFWGLYDNDDSEIVITDNANKNTSTLMGAVSAPNQMLPISPDGIYAFNSRIIVWDSNTNAMYFSLKADINSYDLERYIPENFRVVPYAINSMFSISSNLHINSIGNGILTLPSGDMSAIIKHTERSHWFLPCKTPDGRTSIVQHRGRVFGLTNDGFRFYSGGNVVESSLEGFTEDVSFHIKPDVDKIYHGLGTNLPSAVINRRSGKRTEFRYSFCNLDNGSSSNNDQYIFNFDFYFDPNGSIQTWEHWENGFNQQLIFGGTWYGTQNGVTSEGVVSTLVRESGVSDQFCFSKEGKYLENLTPKPLFVSTRIDLSSVDVITTWGSVYTFAMCNEDIQGNIVLMDQNYRKVPFVITKNKYDGKVQIPTGSSGGIGLPFTILQQSPDQRSYAMPFDSRSNGASIEIAQTADDPNLFLYLIQLPRAFETRSNLT